MSNQIHVSTRKGLFTFARDQGSKNWQISDVSFLGDPVTMSLFDSRDGTLYAGLDHGHFGVKLHRSHDAGKSWEEIAVPVYPQGELVGQFPSPEGAPEVTPQPASLSYIWALEPGGADQPELLWAGTIPGGLFVSRNRGSDWELVRSLWDLPERQQWCGGGMDNPGIHSICVNPQNSNQVSMGVSCGGVWTTPDAGETWSCQADGMRADYVPPDQANNPNIQDVHRLVQCPADTDSLWVQHHNGVFRSTDGAKSWQELSNVPPAVFGFTVAVHPHDPNIAWFVPGVKDECRVPVDGKLVVAKTVDGGQSFEELRNGLPQEHCYDIVFRHCLDVDETGDILAMGSSTGSLWTSENGGDSWDCLSNHLPQIYSVRFVK